MPAVFGGAYVSRRFFVFKPSDCDAAHKWPYDNAENSHKTTGMTASACSCCRTVSDVLLQPSHRINIEPPSQSTRNDARPWAKYSRVPATYVTKGRRRPLHHAKAKGKKRILKAPRHRTEENLGGTVLKALALRTKSTSSKPSRTRLVDDPLLKFSVGEYCREERGDLSA